MGRKNSNTRKGGYITPAKKKHVLPVVVMEDKPTYKTSKKHGFGLSEAQIELLGNIEFTIGQ
jgi:hypothetical protein